MSDNSNNLFCFGMGFTAQALAKRIQGHEWDVAGTCRSVDKKDFCGSLFPLLFDGIQATEEICDALNKATHLLISIPPQPSGDVVLKNFGSILRLNFD